MSAAAQDLKTLQAERAERKKQRTADEDRRRAEHRRGHAEAQRRQVERGAALHVAVGCGRVEAGRHRVERAGAAIVRARRKPRVLSLVRLLSHGARRQHWRAGGRPTEWSNDWTGAQVIIKTATEITVQKHCMLHTYNAKDRSCREMRTMVTTFV